MNGELDFHIGGSYAEVRAFQAGYQAGVKEGVKIGREELIAEQLAAQKREHAQLGIGPLIQGHLKYLREVPAWRREELAGGRGTQKELRSAA